MELMPGYKQTEVGVIPEDWDVATVSDACDLVVDCKNRTPPFVSHSEFAVVRTSNVRNGRFLDVDLRFTDYESFRRWTSRATPKTGDLMLTREAPLGEVCAVPETPSVCLGQRMMLLRPSGHVAQSSYLLFTLMSEVVKGNLLKKIGGSTVGHAKVDDIRLLPVPLPPLEEQKQISAILLDIDNLVRDLESLIAKKQGIKQAAMQELLTGKRRLPGFEGEWEVKRLGEIGSTFGGLTGKTKSDFGNGDAHYVTFMNVMMNIEVNCEWLERVRVASNESQNRVLRGDLLFNGSSETPDEVAMCSLLTKDVTDLYLNSFCFGYRLRADAPVSGLFLAYLIRSDVGREVVKSLAQGSTRYNLSKSALLDAAIQLPNIGEQTAIATVLSDMDDDLASLEARLGKARELKQGMMQQLLTGKIRLQ